MIAPTFLKPVLKAFAGPLKPSPLLRWPTFSRGNGNARAIAGSRPGTKAETKTRDENFKRNRKSKKKGRLSKQAAQV